MWIFLSGQGAPGLSIQHSAALQLKLAAEFPRKLGLGSCCAGAGGGAGAVLVLCAGGGWFGCASGEDQTCNPLQRQRNCRFTPMLV